MIRLENISKVYTQGTIQIRALDGISITIQQGEFIAIMGPSGSGKSTLAQLIGLLDTPTAGQITYDGETVTACSPEKIAQIRSNQVGFVFQQFFLLPRLNAIENVRLPNLYLTGALSTESGTKAKSMLNRVLLGDRMTHRPKELSGGQQQRVAIARSLMNDPLILIADEPTGNLDSVSEKEIMQLLLSLNQEGKTIIVVTHEENIAEIASRIIRMRDGRIITDTAKVTAKESVKNSIKNTEVKNKISDTRKSISIFAFFKMAYTVAMGNRIRSTLSALGILIGVASVITMLALGNGADEAMKEQLSSLGSNVLVLRPGSFRAMGVSQESGMAVRFTTKDAEDISKNVSGIVHVAPTLNGRAQAAYKAKNWSSQILGTVPEYAIMRSSEPALGRFFTNKENDARERIAVLGVTVVRELFGDSNPIGEWIKLNRIPFQVIGILPTKGANSFRDQDDIIVIPVETAKYRLIGTEYLSTIDMQIDDPQMADAISDEVRNLIGREKRIPLSQQADAFQIRNNAELKEAISATSKTMGLLLSGIALISLVVGGIGIMNIMLVSVTERTREIGLRKALGATARDLLMQFLTESVFISFIGGFMGLLLGLTTSIVISKFFGIAAKVTLPSVVLSLSCSLFAGIFFGVFPAKKASKLDPITALRSE